ncbi:putative synaptojanin (N-terminal domain), putative,inositol/phosphatidylinositol phosphatase [Trypanosoma grayi]|uniref:putative synaptojanin (N-terminal domain), putative,inositol/phosphatidylinositol phosphatase n=1 Tax=Trypanosoma grayi TaxID=71804 RepID=UPI0004F48604|nr:putative synaptojanin (N-terminal domain), putative,inositol/phosphatidylinositol phosphatase [Trypanosoma grayi]KEG08261.1 putative synaptojanin (N-terminal domain), putative,inositol/phosphatidylinositol phosphatase [Trypanosoma grayi]
MFATDLSGRIATSGTRVYFVPTDKRLPRLKWEPKLQRFVVWQHNNHDLAPRSSSQQTTSTDAVEEDCVVMALTNAISCCALYGVLPLGTTSILLYVTEQKQAATLPFSGQHDIFAVKHLAWMRLPPQPAGSTHSDDAEDYGGDKDNSTDSRIQNEEEEEVTGHSKGPVLGSKVPHQLTEDTIAEYCAVVDRFCSQSQRHSGGSYLFYSPTINLALGPSEMDGKGVQSIPGSVTGAGYSHSSRGFNAGSDAPEELSSELVFQWNAPLLGAFDIPEAVVGRSKTFCVPAFIRGFVTASDVPSDGVKLLLINRLSYRWSGTRYNRRGLDSAGTGIPANFSASTLWVFPTEAVHDGGGTSAPALTPERRVAAFVTVRGSIPRSWSQPANLTLKPKVTISSSSIAADELSLHLNALQAVLHGMLTLHCLDTTSCSVLESPLSKAFETVVTKRRESDAKLRRAPDVHYSKYNVKERMNKKLSYRQIQEEVNVLVGLKQEDGDKGMVDFSQWRSAVATDDDEQWREDGSGPSLVWKRVRQQACYLRVNCLDCLDRTNLVQSMIAVGILPSMINYVRGDEKAKEDDASLTGGGTGREDNEETFKEAKRACKGLWVQQGIALSQLYAGSDPHFVQFLLNGKSDLSEKFKEGVRALQRWWQQNFYDGEKQDAVSLLTRQHDPALFYSKFEGPFSRRLSGLNRMVLLGLLVAIGAAGANLVMMLFIPQYRMRQEFVICELIWGLYLCALISHIMKDGVSYTNYPLLK